MKSLVLLAFAVFAYADTVCVFNGQEIGHRKTGMVFQYTLKCNTKGECSIKPNKKEADTFYLSHKIVREKHLDMCIYMKDFLRRANYEN